MFENPQKYLQKEKKFQIKKKNLEKAEIEKLAYI